MRIGRVVAVIVAGALTVGAGVRVVRHFAPGRAELDAQARRIVRHVDTRSATDVDSLVRALRPAETLRITQHGDWRSSKPNANWADATIRVTVTIPDHGTFGQYAKGIYIGCYRISANHYRVTEPKRVRCPADAAPLTPGAPPAVDAIPAGSDEAVAAALAALPPDPIVADTRETVLSLLPAPERDRRTGEPHLPPSVDVGVRSGAAGSSDVGIAVFAVSDRHCILGNRIDGVVAVWAPPAVTMQAGEGVCDASAALGGLYTRSPH